MNVPVEILLAAVADAAEQRGVLFITPSHRETDVIVKRAHQATIEQLVAHGGTGAAHGFFDGEPETYWLRLRCGGWVFFYPHDEVDRTTDVGNPHFVYRVGEQGYERQTYTVWRARGVESRRMPTGRTVWDRLLDDEEP